MRRGRRARPVVRIRAQRRRRSVRRLAWVLAMLGATTACAPVIAHGPRVSPGVTLGGSLGASKGPEYRNGDEEVAPYLYAPVGVNVGYGFAAATRASPAFRLGLHVPVPLVAGAQVDAYLQLPERFSAFAGGVGVSTALSQTMPYVQAGYTPDRGLGAYATQGYVFVHNPDRDGAFNDSNGRMWLSTVAAQYRARHVTTHLLLTTGSGKQGPNCPPGVGPTTCEPGAPRRVLHAGMMLEWRKRVR